MGINDLNTVINEMDVQDRYRVAFRKVFKDIIFESKYRTDGLAYSAKDNLRMIIEQKHDYDFSSIHERAKVVAQVIRYVKTIHDEDPKIMPKVAIVGDENECFVLPIKEIINYISINSYEWTLSPSCMHQDKILVSDLLKDEVIKRLYIFKPQNEFGEIVNKIKEINKGISVPRTLTEKNIDRVYEYFENKINIKRSGKKISPNDSVNLFAHIMLHPNSVMLNKNTKQLFTGMFKEPLTIGNIDSYISFISEYSRTYTLKQKHVFTAILDRLIEDTTRRKQGEFFTPSIWVDKAHEYITSVYGEDWKDKFIVWDPAWGTGNLTRDYKFKELYVSTLNQSDIDIANQMGYNTEAVHFQYDFLNDDYEKLPNGLKNAIESGKEIIILMNPPYQDGSELTTDQGESKIKNNVQTSINKIMKENKVGKCSKQLYAQFLYRITLLNKKNNIIICQFCPSLFMTGESYQTFQKNFFNSFKFNKGFIFDSSNFSDTAGNWPISFTIWESGKNLSSRFELDVLSIESSEIITNKIKILENSPLENRLVNWFKKNINFDDEQFGTCTFQGNTIQGNNQFVTILSGKQSLSGKGSFVISSNNYKKVSMFFTLRRLLSGSHVTWENFYDDYVWSENDINQFEIDSIVYSLFESKSNQKTDSVTKNQFFWMSVDKMKELADQNGYDELYNDARTSSDRHVYKLLFGEERIYDKLSPDAKAVLDKATELVGRSMEVRQVMANDENHLNSWDAGYAQLKLVWKEYFQEEFKEFRQLYKNLEDRMRPLVYELGFLKK